MRYVNFIVRNCVRLVSISRGRVQDHVPSIGVGYRLGSENAISNDNVNGLCIYLFYMPYAFMGGKVPHFFKLLAF